MKPMDDCILEASIGVVTFGKEEFTTGRLLQRHLGAAAGGGDGSTSRHLYLLLLIFMTALILLCCVLALATLRRSRSENESVARLERLMRDISAHSGWSICYYSEGSRLHIISSYKMSVNESHFRIIQEREGELVDNGMVGESSAAARANEDETKDTLFVTLPLPGCQKTDDDVEMRGSRLVPAVCAVCLVEYAAGDEITWSSNYKCPHAFHADCMAEYIGRKRDVAPCPMCRRDFLAREARAVFVEESATPSDEQVVSVL